MKTPILALVVASSTALLGLCGCAPQRYGGETAQDKAVSKAVAKNLAHDTIYGYPRVEVYTAQGTTELRGYVHYWQQRERASNFAMFTEGVGSVQNDLLQDK